MAYESPELTIHGKVEELTLQDKQLGGDDGIFLLGVGPIQNVS